jgi:sigma-B regulation protein RsbU (phosphoserine phosphatase)
MTAVAASTAWLIPLPGGPPLPPLELKNAEAGTVIGRHEQCSIRLPADADKVSRNHARFAEDSGQWRIADLKSRWGTFVNGVKIPANREIPLNEGDLIRIAPWTFSFSTRGVPQKGLQSVDDTTTAATMIRSVTQEQAGPLQDDMLNLLLESASAVHGAEDEKSLGTILLDYASRGTGLPNAAMLKAIDSAGRIEVLATRAGPSLTEGGRMGFSRSLLSRASQGVVAELSAASAASGENISQSIVQMNINAALCVPLMLGTTVAAYLYLDSRGGPGAAPRPLRPNAGGFCLALARMAGLALANLKRLDVERRSAQIEAELNAGMAAQKWILPREPVKAGPFVCAGQSRPGEYLGGDFFDTLELPDGRLVVSLGDVSGHGVAASVLMTASQGFLHAALKDHGDLAKGISDLNVFVHHRRPQNKFITLWAGVFDPKKMTVSYVDAGHGYALLSKGANEFEALAGGDGLPVGILPDSVYSVTTAPLPASGRALVISDGIVEQFEAEAPPGGSRRQFEVAGIKASLGACKHDDDAVTKLFEAVFKWAGTQSLSDDATAVLVKW